MNLNAFLWHISVMVILIVMMGLMNLPPSARLHVQLICLPVKMDYNAFKIHTFAMGTGLVTTDHTIHLPCVTTVLLTICTGVRSQVLMFVCVHIVQMLWTSWFILAETNVFNQESTKL